MADTISWLQKEESKKVSPIGLVQVALFSWVQIDSQSIQKLLWSKNQFILMSSCRMICHPGVAVSLLQHSRSCILVSAILPKFVTSSLKNISSVVAISQKQIRWPRTCQGGRWWCDCVWSNNLSTQNLAHQLNIMDYFTYTLKTTFQTRNSSVTFFPSFFSNKVIQC